MQTRRNDSLPFKPNHAKPTQTHQTTHATQPTQSAHPTDPITSLLNPSNHPTHATPSVPIVEKTDAKSRQLATQSDPADSLTQQLTESIDRPIRAPAQQTHAPNPSQAVQNPPTSTVEKPVQRTRRGTTQSIDSKTPQPIRPHLIQAIQPRRNPTDPSDEPIQTIRLAKPNA